MMPENSSDDGWLLDEAQKKLFEQYGREEAQRAKGEPGQLKERLPFIFNRIQDMVIKDRDRVEARRLAATGELNRLREALHSRQADILSANQSIEYLEESRLNSPDGRGTGEHLSFYIGAFITVLLTLYLYSFYAASGHVLFSKIPKGVTNFSGVFQSLDGLGEESGVVKIATFLFPTIFIGLGFLLHNGIKERKYWLIGILILFTLAFDMLIGHIIAKEIYINRFNAGELEREWNDQMTFTDINFYTVLASGFVCYIMWGFLLNYTLSRFESMQPGARVLQLDRRIAELREKKNQDEAFVLSTRDSAGTLEKAIADLVSGRKAGIGADELHAVLGIILGGWCEWIQMMRSNQAAELISQSQQAKEEWLEHKLQELKNNSI